MPNRTPTCHRRYAAREQFECPYCDAVVDIPAKQLPTDGELVATTGHQKRKTCGAADCKRQYQAMMHRVKYHAGKQRGTAGTKVADVGETGMAYAVSGHRMDGGGGRLSREVPESLNYGITG